MSVISNGFDAYSICGWGLKLPSKMSPTRCCLALLGVAPLLVLNAMREYGWLNQWCVGDVLCFLTWVLYLLLFLSWVLYLLLFPWRSISWLGFWLDYYLLVLVKELQIILFMVLVLDPFSQKSSSSSCCKLSGVIDAEDRTQVKKFRAKPHES